MVSCFKAWWTVMRTRWTALGPAWCRGWAQRWPCLFSCCRTSPAHPLLWLQLPLSQLEWRAVGAGAFPWVPICTRSSLICETATLPVTLAKSALPLIAPNFHSDSENTPQTSWQLRYSLGVIKIHSSSRLEVAEICTSRECWNAHRVDIRVWLLLYCISYTLGLREPPPPLHRLTVIVEHVAVASVQHNPVHSSSPPPSETDPYDVFWRRAKGKKKRKKLAIVVHTSRAQVHTLKDKNTIS